MPLPSYYGTEELLGRPYDPTQAGQQGYNPAVADANQQFNRSVESRQQQQREDMRYMSEENARNIKDIGASYGNAIGNLPGHYMQGATFKQQSEEGAARQKSLAQQAQLMEQQNISAKRQNTLEEEFARPREVENLENLRRSGKLSEEQLAGAQQERQFGKELQPGRVAQQGLDAAHARAGIANLTTSTQGLRLQNQTAQEDHDAKAAAALIAQGNEVHLAGMNLSPTVKAQAYQLAKPALFENAKMDAMGTGGIATPELVKKYGQGMATSASMAARLAKYQQEATEATFNPQLQKKREATALANEKARSYGNALQVLSNATHEYAKNTGYIYDDASAELAKADLEETLRDTFKVPQSWLDKNLKNVNFSNIETRTTTMKRVLQMAKNRAHAELKGHVDRKEFGTTDDERQILKTIDDAGREHKVRAKAVVNPFDVKNFGAGSGLPGSAPAAQQSGHGATGDWGNMSTEEQPAPQDMRWSRGAVRRQ